MRIETFWFCLVLSIAALGWVLVGCVGTPGTAEYACNEEAESIEFSRLDRGRQVIRYSREVYQECMERVRRE